jgi:exopolyphosphatase/guanosine-5'-triphosphate,3'-diphosphate pyrophosphatase
MMPAVAMATRVTVRFTPVSVSHAGRADRAIHRIDLPTYISGMSYRGRSQGDLVAVIDVGSNSGRVVVFERDTAGHLRTRAGSRASLRLVHDVDARGELSDTTMARTMEALRDFKALATGAGARRIVAVATAAMRDAGNGSLFAERLRRELGIRIEIISGVAEARYGFAGALRGLSVSSGLLFDLGGGSMELTRFERRRRQQDLSLPFGALRLSEQFLESDPPTRAQLKRLRDHVRNQLVKAGVKRLGRGERLVGTGGTLRNLAKIDREAQLYPIGSLHGYELPFDRLEETVDLLATTKEKRRDNLPGLSAERADSIVGGAVAIHTLAEFVRAPDILVSGQGLREGLALGLLGIPVGSPATVKDASVSSLVARFDGWSPESAVRRQSIAATLYRAIERRGSPIVATAVAHAARVLDIGRSLDVVSRHKHVADIFLTTELNGFTHRELALVSAIVRRAGDRNADILPLAIDEEVGPKVVERAAIILALADEIEARCPRGRPIAIRSDIGRDVKLSIPMLPSWLAKDLDKRFERAFGRALIVRH